MAKITFITADNKKVEVDGNSGSVMELAVENGIRGIDGDCGGVCSCATCHVHVASDDMARVGLPGEVELDLLEMDSNFAASSRLSCQIEISEELDGITLHVVN